MFTCPYTKEYMLKEKEPADQTGEAFNMLSNLAKETGTYLIGGSIPESIQDSDKIYNTSLCFDKEGQL